MFYPCMEFRSKFSLDPARVAELTDSYSPGRAVRHAFETVDSQYPEGCSRSVDTPETEKSWNVAAQCITLFIELLAEQTSVIYAIEASRARMSAVIAYLRSRLDAGGHFRSALIEVLEIAEEEAEATVQGHCVRRPGR